MKSLRRFIFANTILLAATGIAIAFNPSVSLPVKYAVGEPYQSLALVHLLAMALAGTAIALMVQSGLSLVGELRKLARGLGFANGLIALMVFFEQIAFGGNWMGWILMLIPLAMAAVLAWMGWRPLRPAEIAAEIESLKIPDEIRQGLLQQIGEAAAQEERNRLARDLHDSIKQQLFSINVGTATAQERWERDPEGARKALADVRRSAREAMVEMQAMLHQLRPEALGTTGLIEALREQCEALGYRTGAEVTVELGEPIPDDRMPPGAQEALFRMAQEMLANVARHARARHVRLWLGRQDEAVLLHVEDDGQGFPPGAESSGMGLRNLKERAESLRGRLYAASAPGAGTRIQAWVPLAPAAALVSLREKSFTLTTNTFSMLLMGLVAVQHDPHRIASLYDFFAAQLMILSSVFISWRLVRDGLAQSPISEIADVARLRYAGYRARAVAFLEGAWVARQGSHFPGGWGTLFGLLSLLYLVLVGSNIFRAYRWSRPPRRLLEGWVRPAEWGPRGTLLFSLMLFQLGWLLVVCFLYRGFWVEPEQLQFVALVALVLGYLFWRQPLTEGAPPS